MNESSTPFNSIMYKAIDNDNLKPYKTVATGVVLILN